MTATKPDHRAELMSQLRTMDYPTICERLHKAKATIEHHAVCRRRQMANGMDVTLEQFHKNIARHQLIVECCEAVIAGND